MHRAPERREQDGGPEPDPAGQRGGPREELHGLEARERAQHLLHDPGALEAERLRPLEEAPDSGSIDAAGRPGLRNARRHSARVTSHDTSSRSRGLSGQGQRSPPRRASAELERQRGVDVRHVPGRRRAEIPPELPRPGTATTSISSNSSGCGASHAPDLAGRKKYPRAPEKLGNTR